MGTIKPSDELAEAMQEALDSVESTADSSDQVETVVEVETAAPDGAAAGDVETAAALKDQLLRLAADFENFRKRSRREREEIHRYGSEPIVRDILAVVDNFERAMAHADDANPIVEGLRMVHKQMLDVLGTHGVKDFASQAEVFDPERHEAMSQIPTAEQAPGTVVSELEKGYMLHDRLLRPAKVVVAIALEPPALADEAGDDATSDED